MKKLSVKGFTLIELLVVITIIGILATGATAVYTSAQQKARDSIRQNDILALRSAIEQSFGDNAYYPQTANLFAEVVTAKYMQALPDDPKTGQTDAQTTFIYSYGSGADETTQVAGQEYELSANFENTGNASSKEVNTADGGNDANRWEIGINMDVINTDVGTNGISDCTANDYDGAGSTAGNCIKIDGTTS